jgi:hypothetical protein
MQTNVWPSWDAPAQQCCHLVSVPLAVEVKKSLGVHVIFPTYPAFVDVSEV